MLDRAAGIQGLQIILVVKGFKKVIGEVNRQLGGIGVIGRFFRSGSFNVFEIFDISTGQTVRGAFGRCGFQIVKVFRSHSGIFPESCA